MDIKIAAFIFFALLSSSQLQAATVENTLFVQTTVDPFGVNTHPISNIQSSSTGPVSYSSTEVSGSADFGELKAKSSITSSSGIHETAKTLAETSFDLTIGTGTSGLLFGDVIGLNLSFRLDGSLQTSASAGDNTGSADMFARLRIIDPNIIISDGEGDFSPRLINFEADAQIDSFGSTSDSSFFWDWDLVTRDSLNTIIDSQGATNNGTSTAGSYTLNFDTGVVSTTIQSSIGATLEVSGLLDAFSQAVGTASGSTNFFNTYGLALSALTGGIDLSYGSISPASVDFGDTPVVPLPAAIWLFGTALIGLVGMSRRTKLS